VSRDDTPSNEYCRVVELDELAGWEGVSVDADVVRYAGRELARRDGDALELTFHPNVRRMLVETGRAVAAAGGRVRPAAGEDPVELFRLAYERARVAERIRDARRT
jgi:hypothetical protein